MFTSTPFRRHGTICFSGYLNHCNRLSIPSKCVNNELSCNFNEIISPCKIMGSKRAYEKSKKDIVSKLQSSPKKNEALSSHSLISSQDKVEAILNDFEITEAKAIPRSDSDTIQNAPDGYFVYTVIHIWHGGFIPLPEFLSRFLNCLGIAPIQLSIHISSL